MSLKKKQEVKMSSLQEILAKAKQMYGVTDPSLTQKAKNPDEVEKLWIKAKTEVVKKDPTQWFDFVLNENLKQGLQQIKTTSDLKFYGYLKEKEDITELERIKKTCGLFTMTIEIDNQDLPKSCVILYNQKTNQMFRYPDWKGYIKGAEEEKSNKKVKNRV